MPRRPAKAPATTGWTPRCAGWTPSTSSRSAITSRSTTPSTARCRTHWPRSTRAERGVARKARLDAELVRRGLARSREHAAELIAAGVVRVAGQPAAKPATGVDAGTPVTVIEADTGPHYASRGGHKLAGALEAFAPGGLTVSGRRCLDAGASTGGFTDVLLRAGAEHVVAVDVGYGQLAWQLRTDERVTVVDRTNVRTLTSDASGSDPGAWCVTPRCVPRPYWRLRQRLRRWTSGWPVWWPARCRVRPATWSSSSGSGGARPRRTRRRFAESSRRQRDDPRGAAGHPHRSRRQHRARPAHRRAARGERVRRAGAGGRGRGSGNCRRHQGVRA